jgi:hypothetical protein
MDDIRLQMHLLRARRDAEAMGKAMMGPSASFSELKWGDLISQYPEVSFKSCWTGIGPA